MEGWQKTLAVSSQGNRLAKDGVELELNLVQSFKRVHLARNGPPTFIWRSCPLPLRPEVFVTVFTLANFIFSFYR